MAAKSGTTLDDLLKEFRKNQEGNKTIQDQLNNVQTTVDANTNAINAHIKTYSEEIEQLNGKVNKLQETFNEFEAAIGFPAPLPPLLSAPLLGSIAIKVYLLPDIVRGAYFHGRGLI